MHLPQNVGALSKPPLPTGFFFTKSSSGNSILTYSTSVLRNRFPKADWLGHCVVLALAFFSLGTSRWLALTAGGEGAYLVVK